MKFSPTSAHVCRQHIFLLKTLALQSPPRLHLECAADTSQPRHMRSAEAPRPSSCRWPPCIIVGAPLPAIPSLAVLVPLLLSSSQGHRPSSRPRSLLSFSRRHSRSRSSPWGSLAILKRRGYHLAGPCWGPGIYLGRGREWDSGFRMGTRPCPQSRPAPLPP